LLLAGCGRIDFGALASASDAAAGDSSPDTAAAAACPAFASFCDDFESGDVSKWSGMTVDPGNTLAVQASLFHAGGHALDASAVPATTNTAAFVDHAIAAQTTGLLAVRQWVYAVQPVVNYDGVLNLYNTSTQFVMVDADTTSNWTISEENANATSSLDHGSATQVPTGAWTCIEIDYELTPTTMATLYVGDVVTVPTLIMDPTPTVSTIRVGLTRADMAGAHVVIDDVVVAAQHIGCN
jgi:hypothetical protein